MDEDTVVYLNSLLARESRDNMDVMKHIRSGNLQSVLSEEEFEYYSREISLNLQSYAKSRAELIRGIEWLRHTHNTKRGLSPISEGAVYLAVSILDKVLHQVNFNEWKNIQYNRDSEVSDHAIMDTLVTVCLSIAYKYCDLEGHDRVYTAMLKTIGLRRTDDRVATLVDFEAAILHVLNNYLESVTVAHYFEILCRLYDCDTIQTKLVRAISYEITKSELYYHRPSNIVLCSIAIAKRIFPLSLEYELMRQAINLTIE